jgi:diguanylate cyclase
MSVGRYNESVEQSGEFLRLTVPYLSKSGAGMDPISYALWYEYVSGRNEELRKAVDQLTQDNKRLTAEATLALYRHHIDPCNEKAVQDARADLNRISEQMSRSVEESARQAKALDVSLEESARKLKGGLDSEGLRSVVAGLSGDIQGMRSVALELGRQLDDGRREMEQLREELVRARQEALTDALTGVLNRKGFERAMAELMENYNAENGPLSLLVVDIDHFKKINDTYGHLLGDKVLRTIAQTMKQRLKGRDTVARYGGEEFVVILPDTPLERAAIVAEQLRAVIENGKIRRGDGGETIGTVTISVGGTAYSPGEPVSEFIHRADEAMYRSKNDGRNRVTMV